MVYNRTVTRVVLKPVMIMEIRKKYGYRTVTRVVLKHRFWTFLSSKNIIEQ